MTPTHSKGAQLTSNALFSHIDTILGLPDFVVAQFLNATQMAKKRKGDYVTSAETWSDFKSNNFFTNANE